MVLNKDEKKKIKAKWNKTYKEKHKEELKIKYKEKAKLKLWLTKKCLDCGKLISKRSSKCQRCCQKGRILSKEHKEKISKTMKSPEKREQVLKLHRAGTEAIKKRSIEKFKTNPTMKISKRGYKLIYIPLKGWVYYHHYIFCKHHNLKEIPKGYCLYHKDRNPLNNELDNLQFMTINSHNKIPKKTQNP